MNRFFLLLIFIAWPAAAAAETDSFLQRARQALGASQRAEAEFWITRHLSQNNFSADETTQDLLKDLRLEPKGFIPASWPESVRRWFVERPRRMWIGDSRHVHDKPGRYEVASVSDGPYFATLTAAPEIQAWYHTDGMLSTTREWIVAGAAKPSPVLAFGRRVEGSEKSHPSAVLRIFTLRALHHAHLEFVDADGDGQSELVARLTWLVSNGFRQTLRIYRILPNGQLELWKTHEASTGQFLEWDPQSGGTQSLETERVTDGMLSK